MYHEHFGLRCNPFGLAPSAEFFFASRSHREALAALQWGLSDPTGLVLLTGDVGTGKTTVVRELFSRETRDVRTALVTNPRLGFDSLLDGILRQLGVEVAVWDRARMLEALVSTSQLQRVVLVIDEAQQLSDEALEEFRLLSNSNPERLQLMLAGQPELLERLASPRLRQLNQRIAIRAVLNPLGAAETVSYVEHRVRAAGGDAKRIFARRALRSVARFSQGIPRRANILSHNALLFAYSAGSKKVRLKHVLAAASEYDQSSLPRAAAPKGLGVWGRWLPPALLAAGLIGFALFRRDPAGQDDPAREYPTSKTSVNALAADKQLVNITPALADEPAPERAMPERASPRQQAAAPPVEPLPSTVVTDQSANLAPDPETRPAVAKADLPITVKSSDVSKKEVAAVPAPIVTEPAAEVVVQAGDTLSAIAQHYRDSVGYGDLPSLIAANPQIKNVNLIYPGEKIRLNPPVNGEGGENIP